MGQYTLACPCLFGLESLVADEARALGFSEIAVSDGRVTFTGDECAIARANIGLRCAERVLIRLAEFPAHSFEELFQGVRAIPWERFVGKNDAFPVKGWSLKSTLHSVPDCQAIIKKAAVERLKSAYHVEWFEETGVLLQIRFSIHKDMVDIYLDTSGDGLHKRGYRPKSNEAPLKETLAAAIVRLSRPFADKLFCDPMCGSGTLVIEAAMLLQNIAPGLNRSFAAERWRCISAEVWQEARAQARDAVERKPCLIEGSDIDPAAVALAEENARHAGVGDSIRFSRCDVRDFEPSQARGEIVCNPPYGERMLEVREAEELYTELGALYRKYPQFQFYVISPSDRFETLFGTKADKRRKLYNGMIRCELFQYFRPRAKNS